MQRSEQLQYVLDKQLAWISAADARLRFLVPVSTAMLGALVVYVPEEMDWCSWNGLFVGCAVFLLLASIFFAACATFPRTSGSHGSMIFFGGIVSKGSVGYKKAVTSMQEESYVDDLAEQCYVNAVIASKKFKWIRFGMGSLFAAMVPWVCSIYLAY